MNRVKNEAIAEELAVAELQSMMLRLLRDKGIKRSDLAKEMGVSASYISQLLGDEPKNLSVRNAARVFYHLGEKLEFQCQRISEMDAAARKRQKEKRAFCEARDLVRQWEPANCDVLTGGNDIELAAA